MDKLVIALVLACVFYGCEVEDLKSNSTNQPTVVDESQKISSSEIAADNLAEANLMIAGNTEKKWKTIDFTLSNSNAMTDCRLDDEMTFNSNGTYLFFRGQKSCGGEDDSSQRVGSWEVDYDNLQLIFDKGTTMEYVSDIIGLNNSGMTLKGSYIGLEVRGSFQVK